MPQIVEFFFWTGVTILTYTYFGYFLLVLFLSGTKKRPLQQDSSSSDLPAVTVLIAAFNEERYITQKIENTLSLDYPSDLLQVLVVTDGSTDNTVNLVTKFPQIRRYHEPERKGKIHAVNRVMPFVTTPVTIFTDANAMLNSASIKKIVRHYADPNVGGVAGEKRIASKSADDASGSGEGLYWTYESVLKKADSKLSSVIGAAGELFSIRTELYETPPADTLIEDFFLSMKIVSKGYRFVYEPDAYALESASATIRDEWKRKVRISAGGLQAIGRLKYLLNPIRFGVISFQFISHRVLRWTLAPLSLVIVFVTNLALYNTSLLFKVSFLLQCAFYTIAIAGHFFRNKKIPLKGFFVPYYFSMMNFSVFAGFIRLIRGKQSVVWEKAERA